MIDLEERYLAFIKQTVDAVLKDYKLYIFGSRVKGTAKKYSDVDLAIDCAALDDKAKTALIFAFENSLLPYEVDIVDLNNVSDSFKQNILKDLVQIL